jgi:hypothetical protein
MTYGLEGRCSIQLSYEGGNRLQKYKNPWKDKQEHAEEINLGLSEVTG